jgi:hypothetical protein
VLAGAEDAGVLVAGAELAGVELAGVELAGVELLGTELPESSMDAGFSPALQAAKASNMTSASSNAMNLFISFFPPIELYYKIILPQIPTGCNIK